MKKWLSELIYLNCPFFGFIYLIIKLVIEKKKRSENYEFYLAWFFYSLIKIGLEIIFLVLIFSFLFKHFSVFV